MKGSPHLRLIRRHGTTLLLSALVAAAGGFGRDWLSGIDLHFAGWVQETRGPRNAPNDVVIVAIDDFSLQQSAKAAGIAAGAAAASASARRRDMEDIACLL